MLPAVPFRVAQLPHVMLIEVAGSDAAKVVNNMSTNDVLKLPVDGGLETFITDVRGWVVAHVGVVKTQASVWLIGWHPEPQAVCKHLDRYIIREQAQVHDRSAEHALLLVAPALPEVSDASGAAVPGEQPPRSVDLAVPAVDLDGLPEPLLRCLLPVLGQGGLVLCYPKEQLPAVLEVCQQQAGVICDAQQAQWSRISSFWPLAPADISDKTLPQELDRDARAISFTKGCYLGQETIARLDARGQLQKKLCLLELAPSDSALELAPGDAVLSGDKPVGVLTSVARQPNGGTWRALATLRRGHFAPGTPLLCHSQPARVLSPDRLS